MEGIAEILNRLNGMGLMSDAKVLTPEEWRQKQVDDYNAEPGTLNEKDGYDCHICKNRGDIAVLDDYPTSGGPKFVTCKCDAVRRSIARMKQSGLGDVIREKTFDKFNATEPWQKVIKDHAMRFAEHGEGWFFIGGQPGSGKSHLGTAICRGFLLKGRAVTYMVWPEEAPAIMGAAMDYEQRQKMVDRLKKAKILYIDDLFKPDKDETNKKKRPTGANIRLAFEILNHRYNSPQLVTIISSEFTSDELLEIDEATGSRIFERAITCNISEDMSRNYRLRKAVTV